MAGGTDGKTQECKNMHNNALRAFVCVCLHVCVLQSVPPVIVLHIWLPFCILGVLRLARLVWDDAYVNSCKALNCIGCQSEATRLTHPGCLIVKHHCWEQPEINHGENICCCFFVALQTT